MAKRGESGHSKSRKLVKSPLRYIGVYEKAKVNCSDLKFKISHC